MNDIEILKKYYGFNNEEAEIYRSTISNKTMKEIKNNFENEAKKSFYND